MFTDKLKIVFAVAVGLGREATFERFIKSARRYAPEVSIERLLDEKSEGCGVMRARLFNRLRKKYDIVIQIDDDMELTEGWLEKVLDAYNKYPTHNLFTTRIDEGESIRTCGVNMWEIGDAVKMVHRVVRKGGIGYSEFAPGGCMIFCREALKIKIEEIPICEEFLFYGEWLKYNLGKTIVINDAILVHNVKDNPRVTGFRTFENIKKSAEFIKTKYGFTFVDELRDVLSHIEKPTDEETKQIEQWIRDLKKL